MYTVPSELHVHIMMLSEANTAPLFPSSFFSTGKDFAEAGNLQ